MIKISEDRIVPLVQNWLDRPDASRKLVTVPQEPYIFVSKTIRNGCCALAASFCFALGCTELKAQQQKKSYSASAIAQARTALSENRVADAIRILSTHIQSHSQDASARLLLAGAYEVSGENDNALQQYQTILKFAPDNYLAMAAIGELYDRGGNLDKAESILAHAAEVSHGNPKVQMAWAAVLTKLHRYGEASKALLGVPTPSSIQERISFYRVKASIAAGLGNVAAAASEMERALALSPAQPGLQLATAAVEVKASHWRRASALLEPLFTGTHDPSVGLLLIEAQLGSHENIRPTLQALDKTELNPPQELAFRQHLAELLIGSGRFGESVEELKRAIELDPSRADLAFDLALAQYKSGRNDDALLTGETLQKSADSAELQELIGDIQESRGDNLAAVQHYQAAVAMAPGEQEYRLSLALELIRHNSFEPARVVLQQAEEAQPGSWRILVALGTVDYFAGSAEDAARTLLKAAEVSPEPEAALHYLGEIEMDQVGSPNSEALSQLCKFGDAHPQAGKIRFYCAALTFKRDYAAHDRSRTETIIERLTAAVRNLPREAAPHCQLGKAYRWIESWQPALRESEVCARMDPSSADAHYRLAQIYQHLDRQRAAEEQMKLYEAASARVAEQNATRNETIKTFLYSLKRTQAPK